MIRKGVLQLLSTIFIINCVYGQSSTLPFNPRSYDILDRLEILHGTQDIYHSSLKYFSRKDATEFSLAIASKESLSSLDTEDLKYIFTDNDEWYDRLKSAHNIGAKKPNQLFEKIYLDSTRTLYTLSNSNEGTGADIEFKNSNSNGLFGLFYKSPANFLEFETSDFYLKLNPIVNFKLGRESGRENPIFQNTRGFQLRGAIDDKVYFYSSLFENQQSFLSFINDRIDRDGAIPGNGFFKEFRSGVSDKYNGWDYLNAQAFVGFNISKSIGLEFGHGKHFIGHGYHSLLLNDYSHNYFYLKFNTKFWRFHYQNIFAELSSLGVQDNQGDDLLPKKYMAAHYLDFAVTKNLNIGLFESIVFNRNNNFEFQYLNPVIIYRTVEQFLDSPDNVLIGLNMKWNLKNKVQLYSQLVLDEFDLAEIRASDGFWGNKYGFQLGLKYVNVFEVDHLDARVEYNVVRPFTFQHRDTLSGFPNVSIASYTHYSQPLSHPLGASFKEYLLTLRYQPHRKVILNSRIMRATHGQDINGENYGSNVLYSYETRIQDYDNEIGQGANTRVFQIGIDASYELYHNIFADLHFLRRKSKAEALDQENNSSFFGMGIRMNIANQKIDY